LVTMATAAIFIFFNPPFHYYYYSSTHFCPLNFSEMP
jgi:hypothetical protein